MPNIVFILIRRIRLPLILLICAYAISILGFVLIPGQDDEGNLWQMDFFHAFYFVSFMGTTIGFGEIPYAFTDAQRMWALFSIYTTVIAWLYGIGSLLSLLQEPAFRALMTESGFRRALHRINEPFYLICGYGDTGSLLVRALADAGIRSVVIDHSQHRINSLELEDLLFVVPGLCADAAVPENLLKAGLKHKNCITVIALTNSDHCNLKISITAKLLQPKLLTIARAETHETEANISSFGTEQVINPFDTFAGRLALALQSPNMYLLFQWMTSVPNEALEKPTYTPKGIWILCGFGRFGKAVYQRLVDAGLSVTVIEAAPEKTQAPTGTLIGVGTEARTLHDADILNAVGIVAATDDDADNLSILMTAKQLNPDLFSVARQNFKENDEIFDAANADLIMKRGSIIAHKIFAFVTTPLIAKFLDLAKEKNNTWASELVARIYKIVSNHSPNRWTIEIKSIEAPAISMAIANNQRIPLHVFLRDPRNRKEHLACLPLMLNRGRDNILLPDGSEILHKGDKLLFCGQASAKKHMEWVARNYNVLNYVLTGQEHSSNLLTHLLNKMKENSSPESHH
ncbi:MAG TPA: potassium channel protein [Gammaproteobacteria bacterium]|nr:potassium channel protein [Gammaproteobacteria bacterium]